ncbi:RagB/SusD family nutrient uptake outer membrane protein [Flavobacterium sp. SUN052]|uniref:RagB/SusD family nutrient uptake outer membrane protein n=1 Tax=Flavobacterium sp. SUN052 TaxID=3002441 RepID=UPI00237E5BAC|nr:RagB/SusD family nutrient uptake outer membrane protein [Flavobacterium sp. SUN052]MEC4004827.1 RagB/SusD family nutrient uptake outer membrane protein [Flavobacterium sp. SUN052]
MKTKYRNPMYLWTTKNALYRLLFSAFWLLLLTLLFLLNSCDDFVRVDLPGSQLTAAAVYEDPITADAAMTDVYAKLRDGGLLNGGATGLSFLMGTYADELDFYGNSQNGAVAFYQNSLLASNSDVKNLWDASYNQIYGANAVIEGVTNSTSLSAATRAQLKGEALFVRALVHFYLSTTFGAVPYITSTDYEYNRHVSRMPVASLHAAVQDDLEASILLLPEDYVSSDRTRPNRYAAHALLARVALYAGLWNEASDEASAVLNHTALYSTVTDLDAVFLKESPSTVWQFSSSAIGGNTLEAGTFNFVVGPPPLAALTSDFMTSFEANDLRKTHWTNSVSDGTTTWYHPYKYKANGDSGSAVEFTVVLRMGELYLIRAEARVRAGDLIGGKEDLNIVRHLAGLNDTTAMSASALLDSILAERRVELFCEFGHRFFDLKRFNQVQPVLSAVKSGWNATDVLFPIPDSELNLNPNLAPQNAGY